MNHQDSGRTIIIFCFSFPGLGAPEYRLSRYGENASKRKAGKQNKAANVTFPRNLAIWI